AHHTLPNALASCMVYICHRRISQQASYLRLSQPRRTNIRAGAFFFESTAASARAAAGTVAHSAVTPVGRDAPQERAVLENSGPAFDRLYYSARAHHVSARSLQRAAAVGHVHAGPEGHA